MQPTPPELARLIESVAAGNRDAFRSVYDATAPKLLAVILRIVRERAGAEEVLQDVFLRVWQNAGTYSSEAGGAMTWLASIARNRAIDRVRQRREVLVGADESGGNWLDTVADPRDHEADYLARNALRVCLNSLDNPQRDCLVLAYAAGYSREELALRFDRPVNTIKTWLHRALASVRACLDRTS